MSDSNETLDTKTEWLKAGVKSRAIGVDREARVIRGMVLAQEGPFKSHGRGEFDEDGLREIVRLTNATQNGLKSRFTHPTASDDGLGKHLGRAREARLDTAMVEREGKTVKVKAARGDLHFDPSASKTPSGDLAGYVMDLAESDPDALSASLVIEADQLFRIDQKGKPLLDKEGHELPPLWLPKKLHAVDVVDTGDAVDAMLSPAELCHALSVGMTDELAKVLRFDNVARLATQMLNGMFHDKDRAEVEARCRGWLERYLSYRFKDEEPKPAPLLDARRLKLRQQALLVEQMRG